MAAGWDDNRSSLCDCSHFMSAFNIPQRLDNVVFLSSIINQGGVDEAMRGILGATPQPTTVRAPRPQSLREKGHGGNCRQTCSCLSCHRRPQCSCSMFGCNQSWNQTYRVSGYPVSTLMSHRMQSPRPQSTLSVKGPTLRPRATVRARLISGSLWGLQHGCYSDMITEVSVGFEKLASLMKNFFTFQAHCKMIKIQIFLMKVLPHSSKICLLILRSFLCWGLYASINAHRNKVLYIICCNLAVSLHTQIL